MPNHCKTFEHHLYVPNINVAFLTFNQARDTYFTLSNNMGIGVTILLNTILLRSFHKTHTQKSQMSWKNDLFALPPPVEYTNWIKWSDKTLVSTPIKPSQCRTIGHKEEKSKQAKNKCCAVSKEPQSEIHWKASDEMTPLVTKLALVCNMSRSNLQTKTETFNGTWLCQILKLNFNYVIKY